MPIESVVCSRRLAWLVMMFWPGDTLVRDQTLNFGASAPTDESEYSVINCCGPPRASVQRVCGSRLVLRNVPLVRSLLLL
jgi:hypothetical protein